MSSFLDAGDPWLFTKAPSPVLLGKNEAHLWRASTQSLAVAHARELLVAEELARADRFRFPLLREKFAVFRGVLRIILGAYLRIPATQVPLGLNLAGKPILLIEDNELHFNLSHSGDWLAVILCRGAEAGVDIESINKQVRLLEIAERYFSESERQALQGCAEAKRPTLFFEFWTVREAVLKAEGVGLAGLQNVGRLSATWTLHRFSPAPEYVGAAALRPGVRLVGFYHFSDAEEFSSAC